MSKSLQDKYVLVAGASQGIGAEIAKCLASEGAQVIILSIDRDNLLGVAQQINDQGGKAYAYPMDVSETHNWKQLAHWMREHSLMCDVLVNNAYWRNLVPIGELEDEDWDRTMNVSLRSYFLAAREMIPFMLERKGGSIINISSLQSLVPEPAFGAYAVAKGGVNALSRVIAREYGPTIRANTVIPGAVDTPGFAEGEEVKKQLGQRLPLGRIASSAEIAQTVRFLASDMSSFITGTEIIADGGRSIT